MEVEFEEDTVLIWVTLDILGDHCAFIQSGAFKHYRALLLSFFFKSYHLAPGVYRNDSPYRKCFRVKTGRQQFINIQSAATL